MDRTWQNICRSSNRLFFRRVCQAKPKSPAAKPKLVRPPSPLARSNSKGSKASNGSAPTPVTVKWVEVIWSTPCIACWQDSRDRKNAESLKFIHVCIRMAPQDLWSGNVNCCGFIFNYINYIYVYTFRIMHAYCVHCFFWLCHRQLENNYSTVVGAVNFSNPGTATRHFPTWLDGQAGNDKMMGACQPARRELPWMERGWNNYLVQHGRFQKTCLGAEKNSV